MSAARAGLGALAMVLAACGSSGGGPPDHNAGGSAVGGAAGTSSSIAPPGGAAGVAGASGAVSGGAATGPSSAGAASGSSSGGSAGAGATDANLLKNPGFEAGLSPWLPWGSQVVTSNAHTGTHALELGSGETGVDYFIQLEPGKSYELSGWGMSTGGEGILVCHFPWVQSDDFEAQYKHFSLTFEVPSYFTVQTELNVMHHGTAGKVYVDDLRLVEVTP